MKKIFIITKTIWQILLYLIEVIAITLLLVYISTFIKEICTTFEFIERCIMCYALYQFLFIFILTNINDILKDSYLAYATILKKCILYIKTKNEYTKANILNNIDYQLDRATFNNNDFREKYKYIKANIDNLDLDKINMQLIEAEHMLSASYLNYKLSFLLRIVK